MHFPKKALEGVKIQKDVRDAAARQEEIPVKTRKDLWTR